jgi:hypothetical protein
MWVVVNQHPDGLSHRLPTVPRSLRIALLTAPTALSVTALGLPQAVAATQPSVGGALVSVSPTGEVSLQQVQTITRKKPRVPTEDQKLDAFFAAGYDYEDAELLANFWDGGITAYEAKIAAGAKVLANDPKAPVPVLPDETAWDVSDEVAHRAYWNNGYNIEEALLLAEAWEMEDADPSDIKSTAGRKILAGIELPVAPLPDEPGTEQPGTPDPEEPVGEPTDGALDAFFAAGYDYDDALELARVWGLSEDDASEVKITAGRKILAGIELPVEP